MDFDIGNLFYIIITLVVIIIGLLGKKKKPAGQGTGETEKSAQPGFLENLEKAFNMGEERQFVDLREHEENVVVEEKIEAPVEEPEATNGGLLEEYERLMERQKNDAARGSIQSETDTIMAPLEVIHLDEEKGTDYFEVIRNFDAGTAVVYSAIINRVDY